MLLEAFHRRMRCQESRSKWLSYKSRRRPFAGQYSFRSYGRPRIDGARAEPCRWCHTPALPLVSHPKRQALLFIPAERWQAQRRPYYRRLALPTDSAVFLEPLVERAESGMTAVAAAAQAGTLRVDDELHLTPLAAEEEDPEVAKLRTALDRRIGEAQLPELILAVDAEVRFSWIMLGRELRSTHELLMVYAGILAHGTALSAAETARMIPQVSAPAVRQAMRWAADERRLAEACGAVLTFMQRHAVATTWGRADLASSDMMSLEAAKRV